MISSEAHLLGSPKLDLNHPLILQYERKIVQLKRAQAEFSAESAVEVGQRLAEAKGVLDHGLWGKWLKERLRIHPSTAARLMALAEFAASNFATWQNFKHLGPRKLTLVARLSPEVREKLLHQDLHQVKTGARPKTLQEMSIQDFHALARSLDPKKRNQQPRLNLLLQKALDKSDRLARALRALPRPLPPVPPRAARLQTSLRELALLLAESLGIIKTPAQG